jgi:outer membrane immunogenic protein
MHKTIIAAAITAMFGVTGASAADLASMKGAPVSDMPFVWSGPYIGLAGGLAYSAPKFSDSDASVCWDYQTCGDAQAFGGLIGGTIGYNLQFRNLVVGAEADISWADVKAKSTTDTDPSIPTYMHSAIDAIATARLRVGYATGPNLFYLTGGAAFINADHTAIYEGETCPDDYSVCKTGWHTGFTAGAGYEAMLTNNVSLKAEYLYIGMPTHSVTYNDEYVYGFADNLHIARVGLNYKLGATGGYTPLK